MRWTPELDEDEEKQFKHGFISEDTAKARWETEVELKEHLLDNEFLKRNKHRVNSINKFPALAFYTDYKYLQLRRNRNIQIAMAESEGLDDVCEDLVLDNIDDAQTSRGWQGQYTIAKITEIHKMKQELKQENLSNKERIGRFSGLFRKKPEESENPPGVVEQ